MTELFDQLVDWLRIPSISTGGGDPAEIRGARREWAADHVERAGGTAELVTIGDGNPLAVGDLKATRPDAPTVLIYGHYDVQGAARPERVDLAAVRARGARRAHLRPRRRRRQGQLLAAAVGGLRPRAGGRAAGQRARRGRGRGGGGQREHRRVDPRRRARRRRGDRVRLRHGRRADARDHGRAARPRDGAHRGAHRPLATCTPGSTAAAPSTRSTSSTACSPQVVPGPDGSAPRGAARRRAPARRGRADLVGAPAARRRRSCPRSAAARPIPGAAEEYYERNGADASVEINEVVGGEPRTVVPAVARATVSVRLAPGQRAAEIGPVLEGLLRDAAPADADVSIGSTSPTPRCSSPTCPRSCSPRRRSSARPATPPALIRSGGSIPVVAEFAAREHPHHRERLHAPRRRVPRARRVVPRSRASSSASAPGASCCKALAAALNTQFRHKAARCTSLALRAAGPGGRSV